MTSSVFLNGSLAPYVYRPSSTMEDVNQPTFYSNYVNEHIKKQTKHNDMIRDYMKSNERVIMNLVEEQKGLQHEFFKYENVQREKDERFSKKISEHKNLLEVFVGFMKKQEKYNETTAKRNEEHKEQLEVLQKIVRNQDAFNQIVSENITVVKEQFEAILSSLKSQEMFKENISKHFMEREEASLEMVDLINEQKDLFFRVLDGLQDNKEQYDILFDYVRNQDHFNHKLFEYLCSKFEEEKAVN
ncbi:hypothetical protein ACLM5H_14980 [Fredinandcohnia humi]